MSDSREESGQEPSSQTARQDESVHSPTLLEPTPSTPIPTSSRLNSQQLQDSTPNNVTPAPASPRMSSDQLKQPIEELDWRDLEDRYLRKMDEIKTKEVAAIEEYRMWCEIFEAWAMTELSHERERAHKRLRTRIEYVKMSEDDLEKKREHYGKVVQAFQNALALLSTT